MEWGIPRDAIMGVVTDGAANMKCAVKQGLRMKWLYCVAHMLNRAVQVALEHTELRKTLLKPAKKIARHFRTSNKAKCEVGVQNY